MPTWRRPRRAVRKEVVMEPSYAEMPFRQLLLLWASFHLSRIIASMKPEHLASQINAHVAASGNPEGG